MKYFLIAVFALFFANILPAQDTTVVQTFQWSDNFRRDTFSFPDDPGQSWRKIYLVYNMVCRNGSVCGEWDYSCNTFLTDPSRLDSTRQTAPEYVISGFSGSAFEYAFDPTYTYYQYLQHQTQISGGTVLESTLGTGSEVFPLSDAAPMRKTQMLFSASELAAAGLSPGDIFGLKLDLSQAGTALGFLKISLKHSTKTMLSPDTPDLDGFTEVFFQNTNVSTAGTIAFPFYQPFNWDGTSNLLVEISATSQLGSDASVLASDAGFDAVLLNEQVDHALNFGSGSYVDIPVAPLAGISDEITVCLWTYGNSNILPVNTSIFEGTNSSAARGINVHLPWSNSRVYWDCGGAGSSYDRIDKAADPEMFEGRWNHWAFTKNTATGIMNIYLNGALWHSGTGKTMAIDLQSLVLGGSTNHSLSYFGKIDEFQVWDKELDAATIATWMRKSIDPSHPDYVHLRAYYPLEEGNGVVTNDSSPAAAVASIHLPNWQPTRGDALYKNFTSSSLRPNSTFLQGDLSVSDSIITVLDSLVNAQNQVLHYGLAGTDLVILDTSYYYPAGLMNILDAGSDTIVGQVPVVADGVIDIQTLTHYDKRAARFELLSLVTPYGNNLSLGTAGKSFTFDVTDYAPILKGDKVLSIEFGGEWQEDLSLRFLFVEGTPAKPVLDIQNIWQQGRGWFQNILDDGIFEPRSLLLNSQAAAFKIRAAITGHGQNGEFVPRQHYLNVDGGDQEFQFDVWKYCGKNPIYPQGGTWIFDRAGWCPGMATDVHEFKLDAQPGTNVTLDYGLNGATMAEANYLVSTQLVSYGEYSHNLDASIETIMRPNNSQVEYERINPVCGAPLIQVRNNGSEVVNSIELRYEVVGGGSESYTWTGTLPSDEVIDIALPMSSIDFWTTSELIKRFQVEILSVNGQQDGEPANNVAKSFFSPAQVFSFPNPLRLRTTTNLHGYDNSYTIKDISGNVVMSRDQMLPSTSYIDLMELPNGCYTLNYEDSGNDGLSFWFFPEYGNGSLNIARPLNSGVLVAAKGFNPDFGGGVQFDFIIASTAVGTENPEKAKMMSVYPNPATDIATVELRGFEGTAIDISLIDLQGRVLHRVSVDNIHTGEYLQEIPLEDLVPGMYFILVVREDVVLTSPLVKR